MTQKLGRYPVLGEIGQGGFSTVYRGLDPLLDREVALKVMHPMLLSDPNFTQRFRREARALASLRHPQIIVIYEVAEAEGRLFIVMELANGPSLSKRITDEGPLSWHAALAVLKPVCLALDYAHRQGIIHRDLKPSNILLDAERGALLSDFGLARVLIASTGTSLSTSIGNSGGILGTPSYIAPELWEFESAHPQSDIYSLGCIIFEMLTGDLLFNGQTPVQILRAHDRGPQFPERWPEGVPPGIEDVLRKALAREPQDRYTSALDLYEALEDLDHRTRSERERTHRTSASEQWRREALAAMQAGEWGAARMLVGRWLAVAPDDAEALAARAEIDRRRQQDAAPQPVMDQSAAAQQEVAPMPESATLSATMSEPLLVPDTSAASAAVEQPAAAQQDVAVEQPAPQPVGQRSLNIYEVGILLAGLFAGVGLLNIAGAYQWMETAVWMLVLAVAVLALLAVFQFSVPALAPHRKTIHAIFLAVAAAGLALMLLVFTPAYDDSDYQAALNPIFLSLGALFVLLLFDLPYVQNGAKQPEKPQPFGLQFGTRTLWMVVMVLVVVITWIRISDWYWFFPPTLPVLLILIPLILLAAYLYPDPTLMRLRPLVRRIFMAYALVNAIAWPLILNEEFGDDYKFPGLLVGRLAELVLFALLLKGNRDDRTTAAAGDISAP